MLVATNRPISNRYIPDTTQKAFAVMPSSWLIVFAALALSNGVASQSSPAPKTSATVTQTSGANSSSSPTPTLPPIPSPNLPTLPPEYDDIPQETIDCWASHANYSLISAYIGKNKAYTSWAETLATPITSLSSSSYKVSCSITPYGLTTLCDNYPRASSYKEDCAYESPVFTYIESEVFHSSKLPWVSAIEKPSPTCRVAPDYGSLCTRLSEAWAWQTSQYLSTSPIPTDWLASTELMTTFSLEAPPCTLFSTATQRRCVFAADYKAFYWRTAGPTGAEFCNPNATGTPGTPTITGKPNTATVSGLTLTSPSVYHIFTNITMSTLAGLRYRIGDLRPTSSFAPSSTTLASTALTVAQLESEISSVHRRCGGSGVHKQCVEDLRKDFVLNDLQTIRADKVTSTFCRACRDGTIYQDQYQPTVGIALTEVVRQNGVFTDCQVWGDGKSQRVKSWMIKETGPWYTVPVTEVPVTVSTTTAGMSRETSSVG